MVLATISQAFQNYYDELPMEIIPTIGKSAIFTFTVSAIFSSRNAEGAFDATRPLLKAGVAALASTIHALLTPLFNKVLGRNTTLEILDELVKSTICACTASALMCVGETGSLQLSAFKLYYLISGNSFSAWFSAPSNMHPNTNSVYFCF